MSGSVSYHAGLAAEQQVAAAYAQRGFPPCRKRWRGKGGEVDLIAEDGEGLIFVEVKRARDFARAAERLTYRQMGRIMQAASEFLDQMPRGQNTAVRFDVALVNGSGAVEIIENAFGH